jgi:hypothetical protein
MSRIGIWAVGLLLLTISLAGCIVRGDGGPPPTTANVTVRYVIDAGGAPECTSNSIYQYTPVTLTGNDGSTTGITHAVAQEAFATGTGNGECMFTDGAFGLKLGRWRIGELHVAVCDVMLHTGTNLVTIRSGVCTTSL